MELINKRKTSSATLWLVERRQKVTKTGTLRFITDCNLNRKMCVSRQPDERRRDEVAAIDLELSFRNNEKNRWGGDYFEFKEPKPSSNRERNIRPEQSTNERKPASSTEWSEVAKSSSNLPIVELKNYNIAKKKIH